MTTRPVSDDELYARFLDATLPKEGFGHREHLRAAFACLARHADLAEAALAFRQALRRYAEAQGAPGLYHETLTWAYLVLIEERRQACGARTSTDLLARAPELLEHRAGLLARHYDVAALTASPEARERFLLPGDPQLTKGGTG